MKKCFRKDQLMVKVYENKNSMGEAAAEEAAEDTAARQRSGAHLPGRGAEAAQETLIVGWVKRSVTHQR
jgi:hypothetical protein